MAPNTAIDSPGDLTQLRLRDSSQTSILTLRTRSFAMKNAPEELQVLATDQVRCELHEGGVAEVIERVFG